MSRKASGRSRAPENAKVSKSSEKGKTVKPKTTLPAAHKTAKARKSAAPTAAAARRVAESTKRAVAPRRPPESGKPSDAKSPRTSAPAKASAKPAPPAPKKPATKGAKTAASAKAANHPAAGAKKSAAGDRSELLRRLLEVRSGYQRAQEPPLPVKRMKVPERPATRPTRPVRPSTEALIVANPKPVPAVKPKYKKRDLEKIQKALEAERDKMLHDLEILDEMTNAKGDTAGIESNVFSIHLAEHATDNSTLETTLMQRHLIEERLSQVLQAIKRIEEGNFGMCELCSNPISVERLLAKPFARLCIDCRRDAERRRLNVG